MIQYICPHCKGEFHADEHHRCSALQTTVEGPDLRPDPNDAVEDNDRANYG